MCGSRGAGPHRDIFASLGSDAENSGMERPTPPATSTTDGLRITARFLHVMPGEAGTREAPYAQYEIVSREGMQRWVTVARWSDLARMHGELERVHTSSLRDARQQGVPAFEKHTLRVGTAKLSKTFCASRAREMEQLLQGLARALGVSLLDRKGPVQLVGFLSQGVDVATATPQAHWFTVDRGWPEAVVAKAPPELAPRCLTPTRSEARRATRTMLMHTSPGRRLSVTCNRRPSCTPSRRRRWASCAWRCSSIAWHGMA